MEVQKIALLTVFAVLDLIKSLYISHQMIKKFFIVIICNKKLSITNKILFLYNHKFYNTI